MYRIVLVAVLSVALVVYVSLSLPGWVYNPTTESKMHQELRGRNKQHADDLDTLAERLNKGEITKDHQLKEYDRLNETLMKDVEAIYTKHGKTMPKIDP